MRTARLYSNLLTLEGAMKADSANPYVNVNVVGPAINIEVAHRKWVADAFGSEIQARTLEYRFHWHARRGRGQCRVVSLAAHGQVFGRVPARQRTGLRIPGRQVVDAG